MEDDPKNRLTPKLTVQELNEFLLAYMDETALILGLQLSDERKEGYLRCLRTLNPRAIRYAFQQAILRCKIHTFPLPAELIEWAGEYHRTPEAIELQRKADEEFAEQFKRKRLGAPGPKELVSMIELQDTPEWKEAMKNLSFQKPRKVQTREEYEDRMRMLKQQQELLRGNL